ncbi:MULTISPECIES: GAP family protein [unclassified Crossiella]|uniref:GAP family protein n=1 Tax=unclassified Crossiella TaxID=2620835 RepID=UPI001FFE41C9|nr:MULTISPECIES: GAP family protein [unclassified Crossiella]MCK2243574.1 GAP family protein [Crossiella sp. S99.2]MCK2257432.1 GAP family protein [Crossiella sp. S99.1]
MDLAVLPLSITMMAGPQIMSALIFVTTKRALATSFAFVAGVAIAATAGVTITRWLAGLLPLDRATGAPGRVGEVLQYGLAAVLVVLAVRNWVRRAEVRPPAWLGKLLTAGPRTGLRTGLLLIGLFPSDVLVMITVGVHLAQHGLPLAAAWPFLAATVLIAATPLLAFLLFRRRAERFAPTAREWMLEHSWLVNVIACLLFVVLLVR